MVDPVPHLYAKSAQRGRPPESLSFHLGATLGAADELQARIGQIAVAEQVISRFWQAVRWAALTHDAGKVAEGFQTMLTDGVGWGQRHELLSLGFLPPLIDDADLRRWVAAAVVTHHRPLTRGRFSISARYGEHDPAALKAMLGPVDSGDVRGLMRWLAATAAKAGLPTRCQVTDQVEVVEAAHRTLQDLLDEWEMPRAGDQGLVAVLLQGAVTLADHLSSAHGTLHTHQPIGAGLLERIVARHGHLHPHQRDVAQVSTHLLLRSPTGSGKTEAGLLWAAGQVAKLAARTGGVPRVHYTLPYLASINAMATRLAGLLGDDTAVGVAHSRAASYHLATAISADPDDSTRTGKGAEDAVAAARKAVSRAAATRLFRETVRVATPYQLLRGALAGAAHSSILLDSANSVFILDELHAYDPRRLGYILAMMRLWERIGGRIAVLSATLPHALVEVISDTLHEPTTVHDADTSGHTPRHRLRLRDRHLTDPATVAEIADRLAAGEAVLVVANTVAHAQALYDALSPAALSKHGPHAAALLHSRFTRRDRNIIEKQLTDRYATGADPRRAGLVVATQVVEVSLDVDFDALYTAAAPLEALLQRFGRVNRLGRRPPADVIVHQPEYRRRRGEDDLFADGVYPQPPVESGWHILHRHRDQLIDEPQATEWLDEVYTTGWGQQWRTQVQQHREKFEQTMLSFGFPYDSREELTETFDELFDGTEAVLREDHDAYRHALTSASSSAHPTAAGRLLATDYLLPLPHWAAKLSTYDRELKIRIIDGTYHPTRGLISVNRPATQPTYTAGEVL